MKGERGLLLEALFLVIEGTMSRREEDGLRELFRVTQNLTRLYVLGEEAL